MFDEIGVKIKSFAKTAFFVEIIASIISAIVLFVEHEEFWCILVGLGGIVMAWVLAMFAYGFGELIDETTNVSRNTAILVSKAREEGKRIARETASNEQIALQKAKEAYKARESQRAAQVPQAADAKPVSSNAPAAPVKQNSPAVVENTVKEQTLADKLQYALRFSTDQGMIKYLKTVEDETVQNILKAPEARVRELIANLLNSL